jgi:hypothetical protein
MLPAPLCLCRSTLTISDRVGCTFVPVFDTPADVEIRDEITTDPMRRDRCDHAFSPQPYAYCHDFHQHFHRDDYADALSVRFDAISIVVLPHQQLYAGIPPIVPAHGKEPFKLVFR